MEARYQLTYTDYTIAWLAITTVRSWVLLLFVAAVGAILLAINCTACGSSRLISTGFLQSEWTRVLALAGIFLAMMAAGGLVVVFLICLPMVIWRCHRMGVTRRRITFSASLADLQFTDEEGNHSALKWTVLKNVFDIRSHYLLRLKTGGMVPIPKRALSDEQQSTFRALVRASGAPSDLR